MAIGRLVFYRESLYRESEAPAELGIGSAGASPSHRTIRQVDFNQPNRQIA